MSDTQHAGAAYATNRGTVEDGEWRLRAYCRGADPEQFFPHRGSGRGAEAEYRRAVNDVRQTYCSHCPVIQQCRGDALRRDNRFGIWGGLGEDDRPNGGRA